MFGYEILIVLPSLLSLKGMKEDDIGELLRFEKKQLRARLSILKNDKFLQGRLKMETGPDNKAAKVTYYFINYKTFVNVVKYKLDWMRKRMETTERDATSRASFKCSSCMKTFTDLEVNTIQIHYSIRFKSNFIIYRLRQADQLFDFTTSEFRCTFCGNLVEEDSSALPKKDSRLLLAKFNEQLQPLYDLLREVEDIKLSPECLEPEPVDIDTIRGTNKLLNRGAGGGGEQWSGEATRNQGFAVEEARVDVTIGDAVSNDTVRPKDRPVWMTESTITTDNAIDATDTILAKAAQASAHGAATATNNGGGRGRRDNEDIMSVLLQHEKQAGKINAAAAAGVRGLSGASGNSSDSSEDDREIENTEIREFRVGHSKLELHFEIILCFSNCSQYHTDGYRR